MNKGDILKFVNENPICYLATVDDNKPKVRAIGIFRADEYGILIQISTPKDIYKQLTKNPHVEACFNNIEKSIQVRISGRAEFIEDHNLKEEVLKKRPFLKPLVDRQGYDAIKVFKISDAIATIWTRELNFAPKTYIKL